MNPSNHIDAVILGAGPAGCSCALWLQQLGLKPLLIEHSDTLGGLQNTSPYLNDWVVGVPGRTGQAWAKAMHDHVMQLQIPTLLAAHLKSCEKLPEGFRVTVQTKGKTQTIQTNNLVLATGVTARTGGFEPCETILMGPGQHIEQYDFTNKRVAILGGGDNAAENYGFIAAKQPKSITMCARSLRARSDLIARIPKKDILIGPVTINSIRHEFDVVVVMYGWQAHIPDALQVLMQPLLNEKGFVMVDEHRQTSLRGLYAIGEVAQKVHPCVVTAMSDGVICAKAIEANL